MLIKDMTGVIAVEPEDGRIVSMVPYRDFIVVATEFKIFYLKWDERFDEFNRTNHPPTT